MFKLERVIIHLGNAPRVVRLNMDPDFQRGTTTDHVAGWTGELLDARWNDDGSQFAFVSSSRDHKIAHLQIANTNSGAVRSVHKEEVDTYYESGNDMENYDVLFDSNEYIWFSEKSDWGHLYLYDLTSGELKNQITSGEWAVQQLLHIDKEHVNKQSMALANKELSQMSAGRIDPAFEKYNSGKDNLKLFK